MRVRERIQKISGDNSERDPPVPIPNTEVKPLSADGTWLATARESRTSPGSRERLERQECFSNTPITGKRERAEPGREDEEAPDPGMILSSSMAEHSAVNRVVVGSSPTWGVTRQP